jgi:nucleoside-diphosphate-sugar epimerase
VASSVFLKSHPTQHFTPLQVCNKIYRHIQFAKFFTFPQLLLFGKFFCLSDFLGVFSRQGSMMSSELESTIPRPSPLAPVSTGTGINRSGSGSGNDSPNAIRTLVNGSPSPAKRGVGRGQSVLVIGGCGFVGINLSQRLLKEGFRVIVVDIAPCPEVLKPIVSYFQRGATNEEELLKIIDKFHPVVLVQLASVGMSGSPMLNPNCRIINVATAQTAVNCCIKGNIPNLIYTSTYNVIYGGKAIVNGNESNSYFPIESHCDQYAPSKALAEKHVLANNGASLADGRPLRTCAIRPAAIYGEGEQRHFPRLIKHIDSGLFMFRIGRAIVDWVHVENLVSSYLLCAFSG